MSSEFDLSDIPEGTEDPESPDAIRIIELDASIEARTATLCPTPEYGWEKAARERAELEERREYWYRQAQLDSGRAAHYSKALSAILTVYAGTSESGYLMQQIAKEALGMLPSENNVPTPEPTNDN